MVTIRIRTLYGFLAGALLAIVSVWAFAEMRAGAVNPAESSIVSVTPARILDTRDPTNLGLNGPFVSQQSQKLQVTGTVATATGMKVVVPDGATGVVLNATPVFATADGFISIEPGNATGQPTTSSLNFVAGAINPNSVTVTLPTAGADKGKIRITYDAFAIQGPTTDILIDVVGYTTNAGLMELQGRLDTQLGRMDADITMGHSTAALTPNSVSPPPVTAYEADLTAVGGIGAGIVQTEIHGPTFMLGQPYGLKSLKYCLARVNAGARVTFTNVEGYKPGDVRGTTIVNDTTVRSGNGCFTVTVNAKGYDSYTVVWEVTSTGPTLSFVALESVWARESTLPRADTPANPAVDGAGKTS